MSSLGFQIVYHLLNEIPEVVAERIFYPDETTPGRPQSVESGRLLADFPLIFCSVSFENDYLKLLEMLAAGGIPLLARQRAAAAAPVGALAAAGMPLIIAGGVAAMINPEPLAPCIDLFVIGEAEPVLSGIMAHLLEHMHNRPAPVDRKELLAELAAAFSCCYVPELYTPSYHPDGTLAAVAAPEGLPPRIQRATLADTGQMAGHSHILTPAAEFANLYLTELGRGCSRGCRFCAAGFIYRPPRLWPAAAIIEAITARPPTANRIGLLCMEMAAPEDLEAISRYLMAMECSLSFSSLRADALNQPLLEILARSGLKTAALAPDGGSERLRRVINKGITEAVLLNAASALVTAGVKNLKLYFMVGLPTETHDDLEELITLVHKIKNRLLPVGKARGRMSRLTLSVNCFIPKPWTPFQFHPFAGVAVLRKTLAFLRRRLAGVPNLTLKAEKPEQAYFQATLARGDRRVGEVLAELAVSGGNWQQAFKKAGLTPETYAMRQRGREEIFPWEIIDHGLTRGYLWAEYQKGLAAKPTPACEPDFCQRCGVCDGQQ
jgi:radical SAM superfamily enzyme YgiQ (UPF0313 family)